jgi:hypothetical protein
MQTSSSLPDLPTPDDQGTKSSSTTTLSSNINNQSIASSNNGGKHVVLALENYNQIDGVTEGEKCGDNQQSIKKKIKLNIDPTSSSSASSVNLDMIGDVIITEISTL